MIEKTPAKAIKKAKKTFKFWYFVLLETDYMNDLEFRKEFQEALFTFKQLSKEKGS